jgi:hypothetical protein
MTHIRSKYFLKILNFEFVVACPKIERSPFWAFSLLGVKKPQSLDILKSNLLFFLLS